MSDVFTVVGARGFLGTALVEHLRALGTEVLERRSDEPAGRDRGHVVYVSGVAWDGHERHLESFEFHVERVRRSLAADAAESFTYISSTRVYEGAASTDEDTALAVCPAEPRATYKHSKIAGECLCLGIADECVRVVRASNLFGPSLRSGLFLSDVLRQAVRDGVIHVRTSRESSKDYVSADDVAELVPQIARSGRHRIYNIARGENTTNAVIVDAIVAASGVRVEIAAGSPTVITPPIAIARLSREFAPPRRRVEDAIPDLVRTFADGGLVSTGGNP